MTDHQDLVARLREPWGSARDVWAELQRLYGLGEEAADAIEALVKDAQAKQARIDALMLEYCPDEMTAEQLDEWGRHQVAAP